MESNLIPTILYEDTSIIIIHKPAGILSHPNIKTPKNNKNQKGISNIAKTSKTKQNTSVSVAEFIKDKIDYPDFLPSSSQHSEIEKLRLGIVHRLDKDTTGIMVCSKNSLVEKKLKKQFQKRSIIKKYLALVEGKLYQATDTIDLPIGIDPQNHLKRKVDLRQQNEKSKEAITHYQVKARFANHTLLDLHIETGRTHQIRVHLKSIGHPIIGDRLYNRCKNKNFLNSLQKTELFLVAYELEFEHPLTQKQLKFKIDLPDFFAKTLRLLENV